MRLEKCTSAYRRRLSLNITHPNESAGVGLSAWYTLAEHHWYSIGRTSLVHSGRTWVVHCRAAFDTPRRGRLSRPPRPISSLKFQSTPPRRGRRDAARRIATTGVVSIHAPTEGATERSAASATSRWFQSTPPRRGRPQRRLATSMLDGCFNPRPHGGGDVHRHRVCGRLCRFQSTPPRRGRPHRRLACRPVQAFQSTPPRRGRRTLDDSDGGTTMFQSTPPRRGRRAVPWSWRAER